MHNCIKWWCASVVSNPKKVTLTLILLLSIFILLSFVFLCFIGIHYKVGPHENDQNATMGFFSYNLGDLRLFFSGEKKLEEIEGMRVIHLNNFWDTERCAGMTPSIFKDRAFFVDRKINITKSGEMRKESVIYQINFATSALSETDSPFLVEKIYKHDGNFFAMSLFGKKLALLYKIDQGRQRFLLRDFYIVPNGYWLAQKSTPLQWCTTNNYCITTWKYSGFDESRKITHTHTEHDHHFSFEDKDLVLKNSYKNLFLGY